MFCQLSIPARSAQPGAIASYARVVLAVSRAAAESAEANLADTRVAVDAFNAQHAAALEEIGEKLGPDGTGSELDEELKRIGVEAWRLRLFRKHVPLATWNALRVRYAARATAAKLLGSAVDTVGPLLTSPNPRLALLAAEVAGVALGGLRHVSDATSLDEPMTEDLPHLLAVVSPPMLPPP